MDVCKKIGISEDSSESSFIRQQISQVLTKFMSTTHFLEISMFVKNSTSRKNFVLKKIKFLKSAEVILAKFRAALSMPL